MSETNLKRRDFHKLTMAAFGGMLAGGCVQSASNGPPSSQADDQDAGGEGKPEQCPECGPPFRRMMAEIKQDVSFRPALGAEPVCTCGRCQQLSLATERRVLAHGADVVAMLVPR